MDKLARLLILLIFPVLLLAALMWFFAFPLGALYMYVIEGRTDALMSEWGDKFGGVVGKITEPLHAWAKFKD